MTKEEEEQFMGELESFLEQILEGKYGMAWRGGQSGGWTFHDINGPGEMYVNAEYLAEP